MLCYHSRITTSVTSPDGIKVSSNKISDYSKFWNEINFIGISSKWCYNNPIESYKCDNIRCEVINLDFNRCENIIDSCRFDSKTDSSSIGSGDNFIGNSKKTDNRWQQHWQQQQKVLLKYLTNQLAHWQQEHQVLLQHLTNQLATAASGVVTTSH